MVYKYLLLYLYHRTVRLFRISSPHLQHNESNTNLFVHTTVAWNLLVRILQLHFNGACLVSNTATTALLYYSYLQSGKITSSPSTYCILRYSTIVIKQNLNNLKIFWALYYGLSNVEITGNISEQDLKCFVWMETDSIHQNLLGIPHKCKEVRNVYEVNS